MTETKTMNDGHMRAREAYLRGDHKTEVVEYTKISEENPNSAFFKQMVGAAEAHLARSILDWDSYVTVLSQKVEPIYMEAIALDPNDPELQYSLIELWETQGRFDQTYTEASRLIPMWPKKYQRLWINSLAFLGVSSAILMGKPEDEFAEMKRITESESFTTENVVTVLGWDRRDLELFFSRWCYKLLPQEHWPRIGKALEVFRRFTNQESEEAL